MDNVSSHTCNWTHEMSRVVKQRDNIQRQYDKLLKKHIQLINDIALLQSPKTATVFNDYLDAKSI